MKSHTIIYPGTFDPFTYGHEDIVSRAAHIFDKVVIAVAQSTHKTTLFSCEERIEITQESIKHLDNVSVIGFNSLLVDLLRQQNTALILRGLRVASDFEFEFQLAGMNRRLFPEIESIFLTPSEKNMFISSTMIREIARLHGDVSQFISPFANQKIVNKFR